ncbi:hypothetical protein FQR65_LT16527 [Abscondita terminalis]|nr:hypothetical protein FQR65_LT16527 [Abscondita terminalis]
MTIDEFNSKQGTETAYNKELLKSLSDKEKNAAQKYVRFEIRGKLGRGVLVLLNQDLHECVNKIIKYRGIAGVSETNPFVFGVPGGTQYLRACKLIREYSVLCGASKPHTLRGTELRKQIATTCVQLQLGDHEVSDLTLFLGHADTIHRAHYRMPIAARDITRVSRLLEFAQGNEENPETEDETNVQSTSLSSNVEDEIVTATATTSFVKKNKRSGIYISTLYRELDSIQLLLVSPMGNVRRKSWTKEEKTAVMQRFRKHILSEKKRWTTPEKEILENELSHHFRELTLPSLVECQQLKENNPILSNRTAVVIKAYVNNINRKHKAL